MFTTKSLSLYLLSFNLSLPISLPFAISLSLSSCSLFLTLPFLYCSLFSIAPFSLFTTAIAFAIAPLSLLLSFVYCYRYCSFFSIAPFPLSQLLHFLYRYHYFVLKNTVNWFFLSCGENLYINSKFHISFSISLHIFIFFPLTAYLWALSSLLYYNGISV